MHDVHYTYIIQHNPLPTPYPHHPATLFFKPTISFHLCLTSPNPIHPPNVPPPSLSSFSHGLSKNQICHNTNNRDNYTLVTVHHQLHTPSWSHAYLLWTLKQQLPILNIVVYKHTQHQSTHARPLKELELEMRHTQREKTGNSGSYVKTITSVQSLGPSSTIENHLTSTICASFIHV